MLIELGAVVALGSCFCFAVKTALASEASPTERWQNLAASLHMSLFKVPRFGGRNAMATSPETPEMHGVFDERSVYFGVVHETSYLDVCFKVPLKMSVKAAWAIPGWVGVYPAQFSGNLPRYLTANVTFPQTSTLGFNIIINDHFVSAESNGNFGSAHSIASIRKELVKIVEQVELNWRQGPASEIEKMTSRGWRAIADKHGFSYFSRGLRMLRRQEGMLLVAELLINSGGWYTSIRAYFTPSLLVDLKVAHPRLLSLGMQQDIEVGHPTFDEIYLIQGRDEERIREILSPEACDYLIALNQQAELSLSDQGIEVRTAGVMMDTNQLETMLELVEQAATAMLAHREINGSIGPYR